MTEYNEDLYYVADDELEDLRTEVKKLRAENAHRGELLNQYRAEKAERDAAPEIAGTLDGSVDPNVFAYGSEAQTPEDFKRLRELQAMDLSKFTDFNDMVKALNAQLKGR